MVFATVILLASHYLTSSEGSAVASPVPVASAAAVALSGRVVTEAGAPLPGVFVAVQGTAQATSTNASGGFLLSLATPRPVLLFKCHGYRDQVVPVEATRSLTVRMVALTRPKPAADKPSADVPVSAATVPAAPADVLTYAEVMPAFPGGDLAYQKYLREHAHYPDEALARGLSGTVFVGFVVDEQGRITNAEVTKGSGHGFDEEALRIVRLMPWWTPGQMNSKPVRVACTLRVPFVAKVQ